MRVYGGGGGGGGGGECCLDTLSEYVLEADSGTKLLRLTGDSNPSQYCAWFFSELSPPSFSSLGLRAKAKSYSVRGVDWCTSNVLLLFS